jgi:cell division protease FtsH
MVTRFGMFDEIWAENFAWEIDRYSQTGLQPFVSPETIKAIDNKVKTILQEAYKIAIKLIKDNKNLHTTIAEDLLVKEEITKEEFEKYFA